MLHCSSTGDQPFGPILWPTKEGFPDESTSHPSCETRGAHRWRSQRNCSLQATGAQASVQLSDPNDCECRIAASQATKRWPNFLTHECVFQMSLQVTHLARRGARRGRSGARRKIHKGSARPRARKRWSNFLTLVIANTALQLCRGSDGWPNLLTREEVHRPRRLLAPHCSLAGEQRLAQLSDPQCGFPGESASQASCQAAGARRERSVVKSEIHNGTSRPRGRKRWSNFLILGSASTALQFYMRSNDWPNALTREGLPR